MDLNFSKLVDSISFPILVSKPLTDKNNRVSDFQIVFMNKAMSRVGGDRFKVNTKFSEISGNMPQQIPWFELMLKTINKQPVPNLSFFSPIFKLWFKLAFTLTEDGFVVLTLTDITTEKLYSQKLKQSISTDALTGLTNRTSFSDDLSVTLENAGYHKKFAGLFIIDIDNMKDINDSQGSQEGDNHIIKVAKILKRFERDTIKIYRYGDDEFAVLISDQESSDSIITITDTIFECYQMEKIKVSGGISIYPYNTEQKDELVRFANMAVHYAKKDGRNCIRVFEPEMQRKFIQQLTLQTKMTNAILESNFKQYYQPQFDVRNGELRGFEALIRWHDDELGEIPPSVFIPIAEETGLIVPIGRWVMNTAITTLKIWQDKYDFRGIISVNVSPIQLQQEGFISELRSLVKRYEINPALIEIEITEGVMIHNMEETIEKLNEIKNMGIRVSLDDFGTGYSSLSYLQVLPLNTLKIDKSFINDICSVDGVQANITSSIITMVSKMGLETIAEGVEDTEQFELLSKFNCTVIQGFLQGKPMPFEMCDAFLAGDKTSILKN